MIESLSDKYVAHAAVLEVYKYGDVSSRNRLIIIAIHKKYGDYAYDYEFPKGEFNDHYAPQAWHIAVRDEQVPEHMWRYDKPSLLPWTDPTPG